MKKKRLIMMALCAGAALGLTSTAYAKTSYSEIYDKYINQYGETKIITDVYEGVNEPDKTLDGVNFLGLYDLDGNGTEEFLIGYTTPNPVEYSFCKYVFGLDVYTQDDGDAVLCGQIKEAEMWTGGETDCGIRLMTKNSKTYIVSGSQGTGAGSIYHFYSLNSDSKLEELLSYEFGEDTKVNGQKSDQEYEELWAGWAKLAHYDVHGVEASWAEDFDLNVSLEHIDAVKAKLKAVKPASPKLSKVQSPKKGQAKVTWKKVAEADGYQIRYATKKSMKSAKKITIKKNTTTKKLIKNLKSGKTYYFQARAYKKVNGSTLYSSWCKVKKLKVS